MADALNLKRLTIPKKSSQQLSKQLFNPPQARTPSKRRHSDVTNQPSPLKIRRLNQVATNNIDHQHTWSIQSLEQSSIHQPKPKQASSKPTNNHPAITTTTTTNHANQSQREITRNLWIGRLPSFLLYFDKTIDKSEVNRYKSDCKAIGLVMILNKIIIMLF